MIVTNQSHLDHNLTPQQYAWVVNRFSEKKEFFIETTDLPEELGTIPCGLHGPLMGDAPVPEAECVHGRRAGRQYTSRLCHRESRQTRKITVIGGPNQTEPCVLYTAYGGLPAPQEPGDPNCKDLEVSKRFWAEHALSIYVQK